MQAPSHPIVKDVVLVGAGHAHVTVLKQFGMRPLPGVRFTLISRELHTPYSGMLPGLIAENYSFDDAHIDTAPLSRFASARLYRDEVIGLDLQGRRVLCGNRPPVPYDLVSLDIGSTPNTGAVPGASEHALAVKPIDRFLQKFDELKKRVLARQGRARIALVGGGAGGVELMLSVEQRLRRDVARAGHDPAALSFTLITATGDILPTFPSGFRERFRAILASRGILVLVGSPVTRVEPGRLYISAGAPVEADEILWTTQAAPARWLRDTGLSLDDDGFIKVDAMLRAAGRDDVFAAGDTISFTPRALPHSGVYAVRAGPILAENIRRTLTGKSLQKFRPQHEALYLVTTGKRHALGARNGIVVEGDWVWRWKDWIDRRFMAKFNELPEMNAAAASSPPPLADKEALKEVSAFAMRCGGCGAKVGATALSRALSDIEPALRGDIVVGLEAPDDAAIVDTGGDMLSVQTVDYFRAMIDDPYLFGKIAANHALGDIYAMGGAPQSALAIATLPYGLERKTEADLAAMMAGANEILRSADCALVGGHTSEGAEMALGFAVNGLIARGFALRKGGTKPGDVLILTKPIGTGAILAAHMRGKAKARWLDAALTQMIQSNREAAAILRRHGVHAATDVTGFGLAGHLAEMLRAADVDVTLSLGDIPLLDGAQQCVAAGIVSSMQTQNLRARRLIADLQTVRSDPRYPLLFDPQTAGGLLASVPAAEASRCVEGLHHAGYRHAAIIGVVRERSESPEPIHLQEALLSGTVVGVAAAAGIRSPAAVK
ncbi:MAG: selenide, water dikinase SelD [Xanthobacteraceae bacterium]